MKIIYLITFLFALNSHSQSITNGVIQDGVNSNLQGLFKTVEYDLRDIEGSPYINKVFTAAEISTQKKTLFALRYNAYNDQFEVKGDDKKTYLLNKLKKDFIIKFNSTNKSYKAFSYIKDDNFLTGYFVILSNIKSKISLLKKERIMFVESKVGVTSYQEDKPAHFKRVNDKYFLKIEDNPAKILPKNKKDIAKIFPEHSKEILSFIKKNKIKTSKEADLIKLASFINTL